jgi:hypothetical protein
VFTQSKFVIALYALHNIIRRRMRCQEYTYYQAADQERRHQAEPPERQLKRRALKDSKAEERADSKCWLKKIADAMWA